MKLISKPLNGIAVLIAVMALGSTSLVNAAPQITAAAAPASGYTKMVIYPGNGVLAAHVSSGVSQTNDWTFSAAPATVTITNANNQVVGTLTAVPQNKQIESGCRVIPTTTVPDDCSLWWEHIPHGDLVYASTYMPEFYWTPTGEKVLSGLYGTSFFALSTGELTPACLKWSPEAGQIDYAVLTSKAYWQQTNSATACEDAT